MATSLYLRNDTKASLTLGGTAYDHPRLPSAATSFVPLLHQLLTSAGTSSNQRTASTVSGPTTGVEIQSSSQIDRWTSPPLAADATISGTVTFNIWASESSMNANAGAQVIVERHQPDGTISTIINSERGAELGTSLAAQNWTGSPTSTACLKGDRIVVRLLANDAGGNMGSGFAASFSYGHNVANTAESWIQFTENLTFQTSDPGGTVLNLLADASDIGGTGKKKLWTDAVSGVTSYVTNTVAATSADAQVTDTAGGNALEWYTPQLEAVTIDDLIKINLYGVQSNGSANASWRAKLYVTASDGSSPTLIADGASSTELGTSDDYVRFWLSVNTTLTDGQRLMLRVYQTSQSASPSAPGASGFTVTLKVEDNTNPSMIVFTETLTEYSPGVTGTVAVTLENSTSAATGSTVTGSLARTLDNATGAAEGSSTTGTLARTLADATSSATGGYGPSGTLARTLEDATGAATGSTVTGTLARTLADSTSSASGGHGPAGALAVTLADATSAASGSTVVGEVVETTDDSTSAASGSASPPSTPIAELVDTFDTAINDPPWATTFGTCDIDAGRLRLLADDNYSGISTETDLYDFAGGGELTVEVDPADPTAGLYVTDVGLIAPPGSGASTIVAVVSTDGDLCFPGFGDALLPYSATDHRWWRFRESSGSIHLDTAPDGLDWTEQASASLEGLYTRWIALEAGRDFAGPDEYAYFDNVNNVLAPVEGTAAVTLEDATSTAVGSTVVGSVAETLDDATLEASGTAEAPEVTGTVAVTLENSTSAATGSTTTGTVAQATDSSTSVASGAHGVAGTLVETLEDATCSASGTFEDATITGSLAALLADAVASASGSSTTGTAEGTTEPSTSVAAGAVGAAGTLAVTLANALASASGSSVVGTVAAILEAVTLIATGTVSAPPADQPPWVVNIDTADPWTIDVTAADVGSVALGTSDPYSVTITRI